MERIWKKMIGALGFTLCMALAACSDYLDVSNEIAESLDLEAVFRNPAYTRQWHANLFNCISEYSCTGGNNASASGRSYIGLLPNNDADTNSRLH